MALAIANMFNKLGGKSLGRPKSLGILKSQAAACMLSERGCGADFLEAPNDVAREPSAQREASPSVERFTPYNGLL